MGGAIAVRRLERVTNVAVRGDRQAPLCHRRASDVATQPLQLLALMGPGRDAGMQGESGHLTRRVIERLPAVRQGLQAEYQAQGAGNFSAEAGNVLWNKTFVDAKTNDKRSCTTCHTTDLKQSGKLARTGKVIEPMAPSVNPKRFADVNKIKKWFLRNCKWTLGRECTA